MTNERTTDAAEAASGTSAAGRAQHPLRGKWASRTRNPAWWLLAAFIGFLAWGDIDIVAPSLKKQVAEWPVPKIDASSDQAFDDSVARMLAALRGPDYDRLSLALRRLGATESRTLGTIAPDGRPVWASLKCRLHGLMATEIMRIDAIAQQTRDGLARIGH